MGGVNQSGVSLAFKAQSTLQSAVQYKHTTASTANTHSVAQTHAHVSRAAWRGWPCSRRWSHLRRHIHIRPVRLPRPRSLQSHHCHADTHLVVGVARGPSLVIISPSPFSLQSTNTLHCNFACTVCYYCSFVPSAAPVAAAVVAVASGCCARALPSSLPLAALACAALGCCMSARRGLPVSDIVVLGAACTRRNSLGPSRA